MESIGHFHGQIEALAQQTEQLPHQTQALAAHTRMGERRRHWWRIIWSVAAVMVLGLVLTQPDQGQAKTFHCGAGDVQCLIDAIHAANAIGAKNTIRLEAGIYTLTAVDNNTDGPNGLPSVTSPLTIRGAGADITVLERAASAPGFRLLHVAATGTFTLTGLTLRGGSAFGAGGLLNQGGTVTLTKTTFTGNGEHAIANTGILLITRSAIVSNGRGLGPGGLSNSRGTVTILQSTIARNAGAFEGGGIGNFGGELTVVNSAIVENVVGDGEGGGILNRGGVVIIHNSTLAGNRAIRAAGSLGSGGAIANSSFGGEPPGTVSLTNSTLTENAACRGGGIASLPEGVGIVTMLNTILAHNHLDEPIACRLSVSGPDCTGSVTSLGHNLIGDLTGCTTTVQRSDLTGDPGLATFTDDGTPGKGHIPLLPTSQAIDAANNAVCPIRDQLGQRRVNIPGVGASLCDIGAIEFHAPGDHLDGEDPTEAFSAPEDEAS